MIPAVACPAIALSVACRNSGSFPKQVIHGYRSIEAVGIGVSLEAIRGDKNIVDSVLCFAEVYKGFISLSQLFIVFTCEDEFGLGAFHLANINHMVAATQQQVDLCSRPVCPVFVGLARGGP